MKMIKMLSNKTILIDIGDGAIVSIHSHWSGECEIQFAGIVGGVKLSVPQSSETLNTNSIFYANYIPQDK